MSGSKKPVVSVDLGGTKIITGVFDPDGTMLSRIYCLTLGGEGPAKVIERITMVIDQAIIKAGLQREHIGGICLAAPGPIDINRGLIIQAPNLPHWRNIPLPSLIAEEFKLPAFLVNDADAAALGEHRYGSGRGIDNLIYITVSTGIGGGLIINNELYNGVDGCAAEIGHMIIMIDGPICRCGRRGCFEALASGTAIARMAMEYISKGEKSTICELTGNVVEDITSEIVAKAAKKGDMLALNVIHTAARYLGIGLANLVNILNPQMMIIGGGVSKMGAMLMGPTRKSMKEHAFKLPMSTVHIVKPALGTDAGLIGAAEYVLRKGIIV